MSHGPGKYDALATAAREGAMAHAVVLIVLGGVHGNGFSVQCASKAALLALPDLLETLAQDIRIDLAAEFPSV